MTDEEAEYWDDYYTKNTVMPDPTKLGYFARKRLALGEAAPVAVVRSTHAQVVTAPLVREKKLKSA
jgi:hypothetical protein